VLHNVPIEEAIREWQFDAIICGLPFNNFPVKLVQHLFDVMFGFLKPNCELAYLNILECEE
jgi:phospholipid N-methyltransferase